jgi:FkbM family methyltransferase
MVLRKGLALNIDERSREPFEAFCFRSIEMASEFDNFLKVSESCSAFLDIGACHGVFSVAMALHRPDSRVLAVEPSAIACDVLGANILLNRLTNIAVERVACGSSHGSLQMRVNWHHLEAVAPEVSGPAHDDLVSVPMETVDDLCRRRDFRPDLIKIDVEGFEFPVLAGSANVLRTHRPQLLLEIHPLRLKELGATVEGLFQLARSFGYTLIDSQGRPLSARLLVAREQVSRVIGRPEA